MAQSLEVERHLLDKASTIAPSDVEALVERREEALAKLEDGKHPLLLRQAELAMSILADHVAGEIPQIPYQTISVLGVAVLYLLQEIDAIPDFLPNGLRDDELMLSGAFDLTREGIERYLRWKELPLDVFREPPPPTRRRRRRA